MAETWGENDKPVAQDQSWGANDKPVQPQASALRKAGDLGLSLAKSVIAVPEMAVGLADIATGGRAGKFLENADGAIGFRPKQAKDILSGWQSDDLQGKQQQFSNADGIVDKLGVAVSNPSLLTNVLAESAAPMLAGGAIGRGAMALAPRLGGTAAGAIGEGAAMAGSQAEAIRQQTADGLMTPEQSALAAGTGLAGGAISRLSGGLSNKLGIGDVDTMLAAGTRQVAVSGQKNALRRGAEGFVTEGFLEELPQSLSEQALQNIALGKDASEGMADAAVMGTLAGGVMGAGAGALTRQHTPAVENGAPAQPDGWTTSPGVDQAPGPDVPPPEAPGFTTSPGAAPERTGGMDYQRDISTDGLSLVDAAAQDRARAATLDFDQADTTPGWDTSPGAAPPRVDGIDMGREFDTSGFELEQDRRLPSERMGINPSAGPLSRAATIAVDSAPAQEATFIGRTDRDLQAYQPKTGIENDNVIDVQGRVVDDRTISIPRRIEQGGPVNRILAAKMARDAGPGNEVVAVEGGYTVQKTASNQPRLPAPLSQNAINNGAANVQDTAPAAAPQNQAAPTQAPEAARGNAPTQAAPVPAARAGAVEADGVAGPISRSNPVVGQPGEGNPTVVDGSGREYRVHSQRNDLVIAHPIVGGKAQVNSDSAVRFWTNQDTTPSGDNDRIDPIFNKPATTSGAANVPQANQTQQAAPQRQEAPAEPGPAVAGARPTASWVIREKANGAVVMETTDRKKVDALNTAKYEAVPIAEHLASIGANKTGRKDSAQIAQPENVVNDRHPTWRKNAIQAGRVAKSLGIDPKGKRLAQMVEEIEAADSAQNQPLSPATPAQPATETVAPLSADNRREAPISARIGRDQRPLAEGGKPFKTRKAAADAKKLQPMMRVVSVEGGYALADKTPGQLAAEAKASKRLRNANTSPAGEPIPAHAFIAAAGGLNVRAKPDMGIDGNPRVGNRTLFAGLGKGLSIERATEQLIENGYLSEGASHNDAMALIKRSLTQPQYNADGIERIAESETSARFEDYLAVQEEAFADGEPDPFSMPSDFLPDELDDVGYTAADPKLQAEVNALMAQVDAMGLDASEILEDIVRTYANASQDEFNAAAKRALEAAITRSSGDGSGIAAQTAAAAEPTQGLTAPTRDDVLAQQERADTGAKAEAARKKSDADKAKADAERGEFTLTGSDRAADVGAAGGQQPMFSRAKKAEPDERNLIITHNLTGDNLLHAVKMGGIAVPSLAVTRKDQALENFGEITLLGTRDMADPKGYAGTKVYGADIYSPRYPSVQLELTPAMRKRGEALLAKGADALGIAHIDWSEVERDGAREMERQAPVLWQFLESKGIKQPIVRREPQPLSKHIKPFAGDTRMPLALAADPAFVDAVWAAHREVLLQSYDGDATAADAELADARKEAKDQDDNYLVRRAANDVQTYQRELRQAGKVNQESTRYEMDKLVRESGLKSEFQAYARDLLESIAPNERMFQGFTPSGNRKYIPHTLENVVKILKKDLRGGEGFNYGVGSLRAKFTPEFKTLDAIRKEKGRLVTPEQFEAVKKEVDDELVGIAESLGLSLDQSIEVLEDAPKVGVPNAVSRALRDYKSDATADAETHQRIAAFLTKLKSLPTAYFEAKVLRPVSLSEFAGAVVPEGVDPKVLDALRKAGVTNISTYPANNGKARQAAVLSMTEQLGDRAMFNRTPARKASDANLVATQQLVDGLKTNWTNAPEIIVARNMQDTQIPQSVRDYDQTLKSQGATGEARGFIYQGKVYLLADQLNGPHQIAEVLFHEVLGHYGLRRAFGKGLTPILQQVATMRRKEMLAKAKEYGLDLTNERDRLTAAEEILAEMAQATPEIGFVKRAIAVIRNWMRANVPGFQSLKLTDNDIIQKFLLPARRYVTNGVSGSTNWSAGPVASFNKANPDEFIANGGWRNTKIFGDLSSGKAFLEKGFSGLDVPLQRRVLLRVFGAMQDLKIADAVIELVPVDMVNMLSGVKLPAKVLLHNKTVLKHLLSITDSDKPIPLTADAASALIQAAALVTAKKDVVVGLGRDAAAGLSAIGAGEINSRGAGDGTSTRLTAADVGAIRFLEAGRDGIEFSGAIRAGNDGHDGDADNKNTLFTKNILPARGAVTRSKETGAQSLERAMAAFSRTPGDQTQTEAFKRWFAGSRVVDAQGKPLLVYHGTAADFDAFDKKKSGAVWSSDKEGFFFSSESATASEYADFASSQTGGGANVMPVYVSLKNPLTLEKFAEITNGIRLRQRHGDGADALTRFFDEERDLLVRYAKQEKNDGILLEKDGKKLVVAFRPEQIKSAIGNNGDFGPTNPDIRFSRANGASAWDAPEPSRFDALAYKVQDKHIDTKRVVESITKTVGQIKDSLNVYLQEELYHGRAARRVADFGGSELKPMLNQMRMAGLSLDDVEEYLHARHAKEANALIASREPGMPDGGSGMTNKAADDYMRNLPADQKRKLEAVAKKVDAITASTRQLYADYGLEDQKTVDGWGAMFANYVPLMREGKDGGMGIGQGFTVKGKEVKGRTGSTRKVVDILANIAAQREKVIVRGEKNRVATALVGLAAANPNPEFWEARSQPPTERVYDAKTNSVVDRPDSMFKQRANVVTAKVKDAKGNVTEQAVVFNEDDPRAMRMAAALKNLDAANLEGLLGVSAKITRYFSAVNTQYNPVFGVVNLVRDVQGAMVNLAATPLAGQQGKIAKDTLSALASIYQDVRAERSGKQATSKWSKLWAQMQEDGGTTGYRDLFATTADRANSLKSIINPEAWADSPWGKVFTANGTLKVPLTMAKQKAGVLFDWLSDYNDAMENGVRLAVYKAALDKGMSREQAASMAKNLTVNFNRKGQIGQQAGALYAFFNAAMQGTARIGQTLFDMDGGNVKTIRLSKTGKAVVYGGVTLGAVQALMLAGAGFDDEDPPEFVRERSLVIPTGGKTYVSIPMPLGLHVIPGIGRHATEFALSGFEKPAKRVVSMLGMLADAFNPIGNSGLSIQTIAPTVIDPLVALTENRDWTGKPIARVSSNKAIPGHSQWKDTATGMSKVIAEAINWISGGDEYVAGAFSPTPDQIDYLIAQVTGGVGREISKVEQAAKATLSGEELPTYKTPLLGRFYGNAEGQASEGAAFYANVDKLNEIETKVKAMRKDGKMAEASEYLRSKPEAVLIFQVNAAERRIQQLKRDKRELIEQDASREQVRAKEVQITEVMARLNRAAEAKSL